MTTWYVLTEQVANDMGWLHPIKRVRNYTKLELPGNIKKPQTAYRYATTMTPEQTLTCKQLWNLNKKRPLGERIEDQVGYVGHPSWTDEKCRKYHAPHNIGGQLRVKLFPGWRVNDVTTDRDEALAYVAGLGRRGGEA